MRREKPSAILGSSNRANRRLKIAHEQAEEVKDSSAI